ncbi:MAG: hypothetical protein AAGF89_13965 [Bacteroidota bacterium]
MNKYAFFLSCLLITSFSALRGQEVVLTEFSPGFGSISLEDMTMVSVNNPGPTTVRGTLRATLQDLRGELVAELRSREVVLQAGGQLAYASIPWSNRPTYGSSRFARTFSQLGLLAHGEFVLCFKFFDGTGRVLGERCAEKRSSLEMNFSLVYPEDRAEVSETRPILGWEDVARFGIRAADLSYHLVLVELQKGQSPAEALERNPALLTQRGLHITSLLYPLNAKQLEVGRTYAWMVRAYVGGDQLVSSQQWIFSIGQPVAKAASATVSTFAMLSTELVNRYYLFDDNLCLGFDNNEGITNLDYRIIDLDNNDAEVANLPVVTSLVPGLNTLSISTTGLGLQTDHTYRIEVSTPRKQYYFLHFRYVSL